MNKLVPSRPKLEGGPLKSWIQEKFPPVGSLVKLPLLSQDTLYLILDYEQVDLVEEPGAATGILAVKARLFSLAEQVSLQLWIFEDHPRDNYLEIIQLPESSYP